MTPKIDGRLTLNPLPHLAPLGIALPVGLSLLGVPFIFGWGRPVRVDQSNMKDKKWGYVMVAAAGPVANLFLCTFCVLLFMIYYSFFAEAVPTGHLLYPFVDLLKLMVFLNAILAVFNLLPFPPLDGGTILPAFLPVHLRNFFEDYIAPYGFFIFLALLFSGGMQWIDTAARSYIGFSQRLIESVIGF